MIVDPAKIVIIINLEPPRNIKHLCVTLGHTRYYRKFIKTYAQIIVPMEKILKKDVMFCWGDNFQERLVTLKENMVIVPVLTQVVPQENSKEGIRPR